MQCQEHSARAHSLLPKGYHARTHSLLPKGYHEHSIYQYVGQTMASRKEDNFENTCHNFERS